MRASRYRRSAVVDRLVVGFVSAVCIVEAGNGSNQLANVDSHKGGATDSRERLLFVAKVLLSDS